MQQKGSPGDIYVITVASTSTRASVTKPDQLAQCALQQRSRAFTLLRDGGRAELRKRNRRPLNAIFLANEEPDQLLPPGFHTEPVPDGS
ncbi:hypothetical protein VTI74DRAFT_4776 [Chaetomium olivicolor]